MSTAPRLAGLDALRGIAALLVMGLHANAVFGGLGAFSKGYLGVDFFLMLSGFLMARITEPRLAAGLSPQRFMVARYKRFWGMVALGSLIGIPYLWIRSGGQWWPFVPALFANFALLPWPVANLLFALNIPAWTIFAELVANGAHVFALRRLNNRALTLLTILLGGLAVWVALSWGSLDVGARPGHVWAAIPRVFFAYCLGIALWRWRQVRVLVPLPTALVLTAMPLAIMGSWYADWRTWQFDLAFVMVLCPLVISAATAITRQTPLGWLSAAISFPLFAIHLPILEAVRELGGSKVQAIPLALSAALIIVWWTNRRDARKALAKT
ncbi:MAG: acyltransferase [Sphingomonadaceae bacterium]|nr:acyltransferase [Sphingomonadaceae bacterium]